MALGERNKRLTMEDFGSRGEFDAWRYEQLMPTGGGESMQLKQPAKT